MLGYLSRGMRIGALLVLFALSVGCGKTDQELEDLPDPRGVVGLTKQFPAVVKVVAPGGRGLCTGTFVSPRAVLTATHCTLEPGRYTVIASFGTFYTTKIENFGIGVVDDPQDLSILHFEKDLADPEKDQVIPIGGPAEPGETVRLVGFGCNSLTTKRGAGVKRTGTNKIYRVTDYIELITPLNGSSQGARGILGPVNRAGSCFGDSGGPMFRLSGGALELIGVAHAGGQTSTYTVSEYVDVNLTVNALDLSEANSRLGLGILGI